MGIRKIIAIVSLGFIAINVQAGSTNSWKTAGSSFWDTRFRMVIKRRTIHHRYRGFHYQRCQQDSHDRQCRCVGFSYLTISNLTVGGVGITTNTLLLNEGGTNVPLEILSSMLVSNAGVLQITNSFLQVDGGSGGQFTLLGTMRVLNIAKVQLNRALIGNGAVMQFALGTNSNPVAITTDLTLGGTLNIIDGGGFTNTTYTLFTYGGVLTDNGLVIGTTPTNSTCVLDTSILGQVNVTVTLPQPPSSGTFKIVSIARSTNDIVINWTSANAGPNEIQAENGVLNTNNFADISAPISVSAGATNTYTDTGGATNTPPRFYRVRATQ